MLRTQDKGSDSLANIRRRILVYCMTQGRWALAKVGRRPLGVRLTMPEGGRWLSGSQHRKVASGSQSHLGPRPANQILLRVVLEAGMPI